MKKMFLVISIFLILLIGCAEKETIKESKKIKEIEEKEEIFEIVIKNLDKKYNITKEEMEYIKENNRINIKYLNGMNKFIYDYDTVNNQISLVYKDDIYFVDFNKNILLINNTITENDMLFKKADVIFISLDKLRDYFNMEYIIVNEPNFSLNIEVNSELTPIEKAMDKKKSMLPDKINMTWEAVYNQKTNISKIGEMPGLDIISPVWFNVLSDSIKSKVQEDYIEFAQKNNYILWPAVTNSFDLDITHEFLKDFESRDRVIKEILSYYKEHQFHGINIDFENIYKKDKDKLSQFIAELTSHFHHQGMIVSMDVTFKGGSDTWSKCYDRKTLGEFVDYICIMSYDEHWASSQISGSVASLNWLDENFSKLIEEVPAEKIIMGIPFYMRVWFERPHKEIVNKNKVTSDAITMYGMENILKKGKYNVLFDEKAGQDYISFIDAKDNALKKIWIENEKSIRLKVQRVHQFNFKGVASWRRGYETPNIWPAIEEELRKEE